MFFWCIVFGACIALILLRDGARKSPSNKESPISPGEYSVANHVPTTRKETDELLKAYGIEQGFSKDYSNDNEFCKRHPCDYMKPYRLPTGELTYRCTNANLWEMMGLKDIVLRNLNDGGYEQCVRCSGIPCRGDSRKLN